MDDDTPAEGSARAMARMLNESASSAWRRRDALYREMDAALPDGKITVHRFVGLDGKVRLSRRTDTTERDNRIRDLRADGMPMRAIAEAADCSVGTVHRVLRGAAG